MLEPGCVDSRMKYGRLQGAFGGRVVYAILYLSAVLWARGQEVNNNTWSCEMKNLCCSYGSRRTMCSCSCSGVRKANVVDWLSCFQNDARVGQPQRVDPNSYPRLTNSRNSFRRRFAAGYPKPASMRQLGSRVGPRNPSLTIAARCFMSAPDTPQVPEAGGVQCCLDHDRPCRSSRVSWCDCNTLPFLPHVMNSFP
jgi:hypothetical protein